jgi:ornithine decarboxylase
MYIEEAVRYKFPLDRFITDEKFNKLKDFIKDKSTPLMIMDLEIVKTRYTDLIKNMPFAKVYFAVKACPMNEVITVLFNLGSNFDVASRFELDQIMSLGVPADRISYGNTIKKHQDIEYFYERGIRLFVTDSDTDLLNLAKYAPGSKVFFRLLTEGRGADWPLSRKFGAHPDMIYSLILTAKELGLDPFGLSFHVGSQQRDIGQWDDAISRCKYLFDAAEEQDISMEMINLGGGFPAEYLEQTFPVEEYAHEITRFLEEDFAEGLPLIYLEPGRSLTADAGIIVAEVVNIATKSKHSSNRWVYLDIGMFGGLIETMNESIKYPIYFDREGEVEEVILAGPTCDSMDILYENYHYDMPDTVEIGDKVYIFTTGAYTSSYSSVYFNGFPPLKTLILPS